MSKPANTTAKAAKATAPKAAPKAATAPKAAKAATPAPAKATPAPAKAAPKAVKITPEGRRWKFDAKSVTLDGHEFAAEYSVAGGGSGDVYVFVVMDDVPVRLHIAARSALYSDALIAALTDPRNVRNAPAAPKAATAPKAVAPKAAKAATPAPAKATPAPAKAAPAKAAKAAPKAAAPKAAPKAATAPKAAAPIATPADKAWVGSAITGKGWRIAFDEAAQRTRVSFTGKPTAKQKAAVEAAGFYFSASLKTWNKKLTCKAYRAAQELAQTLTALK